MAICTTRFLLILSLISAVPIAFLISLELATPPSRVYYYHSSGFFRETAKWDDLNRRFLVGFMEGGVGQIAVPDGGQSPETVLEEVRVIDDPDLRGNASLGISIDRPRNRLLVVTSDVRGKRFNGLAAYDLSTWNRQFLTQLSGPSDEKSFADDVAVDSEGNAYVTDVKQSKIWKVGVDGKFMSTIKSSLFIPKERYKRMFGLNGIVYHPDGFLIVVHSMSGDLFKVDLDKGSEEAKVKPINVTGGHLTFGDGLELLSPTKLVVARHPYTRMLESLDGWETAAVVATLSGLKHRWVTAATVKDGKVYVNHMLGMGYPKKKHAIVEATFSA